MSWLTLGVCPGAAWAERRAAPDSDGPDSVAERLRTARGSKTCWEAVLGVAVIRVRGSMQRVVALGKLNLPETEGGREGEGEGETERQSLKEGLSRSRSLVSGPPAV